MVLFNGFMFPRLTLFQHVEVALANSAAGVWKSIVHQAHERQLLLNLVNIFLSPSCFQRDIPQVRELEWSQMAAWGATVHLQIFSSVLCSAWLTAEHDV